MATTRIYTAENSTELERAQRRYEIFEQEWARQFELDHGFAPTIGAESAAEVEVRQLETPHLDRRLEADEAALADMLSMPVEDLL